MKPYMPATRSGDAAASQGKSPTSRGAERSADSGLGRLPGGYVHSFGGAPPAEPLAPLRAAASEVSAGQPRKRIRGKTIPSRDLPGDLQGRLLPLFVQRATDSLDDATLEAMRYNLRRRSGVVNITIGTACSGSEVYLAALPWLEKALGRVIGRPIRFVHKWSCEADMAKRRWIEDNFRPRRVFTDIKRLADGVCDDSVSGSLQEVDDVEVVIAGTSCRDASRLNPHHHARLTAVDSGTHSTGGTFRGLTDFLARLGCRCRLVFLENVVSLRDKEKHTGRSNLDGVADALRSLGYQFLCRDFSARDMGLPVARPRLYMAGVRCRDEGNAQAVADRVVARISERSAK